MIYNISSSQQNGTTTDAASEETDAAKSEAEEGEEDIDIEGEIKEAVSGGPVDFNLYQKLWSLQDFFRQPTHCFSWMLAESANHDCITCGHVCVCMFSTVVQT